MGYPQIYFSLSIFIPILAEKYFNVLRYSSVCAVWMPWKRGRKCARFSGVVLDSVIGPETIFEENEIRVMP